MNTFDSMRLTATIIINLLIFRRRFRRHGRYDLIVIVWLNIKKLNIISNIWKRTSSMKEKTFLTHTRDALQNFQALNSLYIFLWRKSLGGSFDGSQDSPIRLEFLRIQVSTLLLNKRRYFGPTAGLLQAIQVQHNSK